ncbi:glycosyltransferase [Cellulomonas sp. ATA003]|uniref:glycosyltransferase n=1 Tax=Cellulomonas sp. ATA003 TaxID=3073064 RepID=UPI002872B33A|nr:glycosyltransferase [Cellulomonas sp. ATA003]WNB85441.1 glycosyltransferase [Cellulomonas sp. ATA003]
MTRLHLVASLGGHLELLQVVAPALDGVQRIWLTSEGVAATRLRDRGERVVTLPRLDRGSAGLRSVLAGVLLALRERPRVIVTSGAGLAVPFCLTARVLGARIVHVETMARVMTGSSTGRLLAKVADAVLVQWDELRAVYPHAEVCRPALLEGAGAVRAGGTGTFVTVGSHDQPFDRLLAAVRTAADHGVLPQPVLIQRGVAPAPGGAVKSVDFMPREQFESAMASAQVVVAHVGAGAVASSIRSGKRPIVLARREARGEHVDDHQVQLARKLDELGLAVLVEDRITAADVEAARQLGAAPSWDALPASPTGCARSSSIWSRNRDPSGSGDRYATDSGSTHPSGARRVSAAGHLAPLT